jgi:hypothetical protein
MTKQQPEALRLAGWLDVVSLGVIGSADHSKSAAELRRLHESNKDLLEALKSAAEALEIASAGGGVDFYAYAKTARAAIAKATGGTT